MTPKISLLSLVKGIKVTSHTGKTQFKLNVKRVSDGKLKIWYNHNFGGSFQPRPFIIPVKLKLDRKTCSAFGLIQAEGVKKSYYSEVQFANTEFEIVKFVLDYFEEYFYIPRNIWRCVVSCKRTNDYDRIISYWSKNCNIPAEKVKLVPRPVERFKSAEYGCATLRLANSAFYSIILAILNFCKNELSEKTLLAYYLSGLLAGDGTVKLNKYGSIDSIGLAYDYNTDELAVYSSLLDELNIKFSVEISSTMRIIRMHNWKQFLTLFTLTGGLPFSACSRKNELFYRGMLNNRDIKSVRRLNLFADKSFSVKDFSAAFKIHQRSSYDLLTRWASIGYLEYELKSKRGMQTSHKFRVSSLGKELLASLNNIAILNTSSTSTAFLAT